MRAAPVLVAALSSAAAETTPFPSAVPTGQPHKAVTLPWDHDGNGEHDVVPAEYCNPVLQPGGTVAGHYTCKGGDYLIFDTADHGTWKFPHECATVCKHKSGCKVAVYNFLTKDCEGYSECDPTDLQESSNGLAVICAVNTDAPTTAAPTFEIHEHDASASTGAGAFTSIPTRMITSSPFNFCMPWMDCWTNAPTAPATGTPTPAPTAQPTPAGGPGAGGDPFTTYQNKKTQFWATPGVPLELMQCGRWSLRASVFNAGGEHQWFKDMQVVRDMHVLANISVAPSVSNLTAETLLGDANGPATILVQTEEGVVSAIGESKVLRGGGAANAEAIVKDATQRVAASLRNLRGMSGPRYEVRVAVSANPKHKGFHSATMSCAEEMESGLAFEVSAAPAVKMQNRTDRIRHTHLDLAFLPSFQADAMKCRGILPQIWGIEPLSEAVSKMLVPPKVAANDEEESTDE